MDRDLDKRWKKIGDRHSAAVERFLTAAIAIDGPRWQMPRVEGGWTPAQITQHITQTYEVLTRQLRTGEGLTVRTGWLQQRLLRVLVLRPIMWFRKIPSGAKAPRELRPREVDLTQELALERLRAVVAEFEAELLARRGQSDLQMTHHIFGSVDALNGLDFVAVHTEHHSRQLATS